MRILRLIQMIHSTLTQRQLAENTLRQNNVSSLDGSESALS